MFAKLFLTSAIFSIVALSAHAENSLHATTPATAQATNAEGIILEFDATGDLWQRIKQGYALKPLSSPLIVKHEDWYASRPDYMQRMISRSERYLHYIVEEVEKRDMPTEIALLPMIESGFNPLALSRSSASGIWQFMPITGKYYGLEQNWWADYRRDVTAATDAALDYLQKLHLMFGNWDLALAAYNAGEGTVKRAIESNHKKGLPTDYQSLQLSEEARNYVPKLQAMKNLISEPEKYGLSIDSIPDQPYFTKVIAPEQIDAALAAALAEIPYDEFAALNPEYNRPVLISQDKNTHEILLPISSADIFLNNLANYDQPLVSWQTYQAKRGEPLQNIATKFGLSTTELRRINDLSEHKALASNRLILVPTTFTSSNADPKRYEKLNVYSATELGPKENIRHQVAPNETLYAIALRYGVSVDQIMASNQLKNSHLKVGQILIIIGSKKTAIQKQAILCHHDLT
jgi:membrane-bound lytic murein transglycosylase D